MSQRFGRRAAAAMLVMVALAAMAHDDAAAQGCSMCGSSLQDGGDPLAQSISRSVVLMASMPFALFVAVAGWLAWKMRAGRNGDKGEAEGTDE